MGDPATKAPARWYGLYPAFVSDVRDPGGLGGVKVSLRAPDTGAAYEKWARLATQMAGNNRGSWFVPDVNDEVLVGFEGGDPRRPYVIGALWNDKNEPPQTMDPAGHNVKKVLRSRNGVKVTLDDTDGREQLVLETPGGQRVTLQDGPGRILVEDSNGNSVELEPSGITVTASANVTVNASTAEISVGALTVNAGVSTFSGVVKADTVITNSVVASSYTPGTGNIL